MHARCRARTTRLPVLAQSATMMASVRHAWRPRSPASFTAGFVGSLLLCLALSFIGTTLERLTTAALRSPRAFQVYSLCRHVPQHGGPPVRSSTRCGVRRWQALQQGTGVTCATAAGCQLWDITVRDCSMRDMLSLALNPGPRILPPHSGHKQLAVHQHGMWHVDFVMHDTVLASQRVSAW